MTIDGVGCVFCEIVHGRAEASLVYADDAVIAFMDVAPINPGHVLVVPRDHASRLSDLTEDCGTQMWRIAQRTAGALRGSGLRVDGIDLWLADGAVAGQEVPHVHLHVLPRYTGDSVRFDVNPMKPDRAELDANAAKIGRTLTV
jgi:histidine triad (HIT) family protein